MNGYLRALEAILAGIIILYFLAFIPKSLPTHSTINPTIMAYKALNSLDNSGKLREYAVAKDYQGLNSEIKLYTYNHSVQICDYTKCYGEVPKGENIWTGEYFISGKDSFHPYKIKLYLWEK